MKGFCPSCEKESELQSIHQIEDVQVRGETIPVEMEYFVCVECGVEFDSRDPAYDPLKVAYEEYRRRKGMVQPGTIKAFREKYGLTQRDLNVLAGFGGATLSRYENGALQDEAHDRSLQLLMQPKNLLKAVEENKNALDAGRREKLIQRLQAENEKASLLCFLEDVAHYQKSSILSGNQTFDIEKLLGVVRRLCFGASISKTKLCKLLFYTDFLHFKMFEQSISGLCYAHLPHGPVPDQYKIIFEALLAMDETIILTEEVDDDSTKEYFTVEVEPQDRALTEIEQRTIHRVIDLLGNRTARQLSDLSHQEEGYLQTRNGDLISFEFAARLTL